MNLHNIVSSAIGVVNPHMAGVFMRSNGYTTLASGKRVPTYLPGLSIQAQVQALQYKDLMQLDGLNINGEKRAMYVNGDWQGVSRPEQRGGDLIVLKQDSSVWLVVLVLENWQATAGFNKLATVKQMPGGQLDIDFILDQSRLLA